MMTKLKHFALLMIVSCFSLQALALEKAHIQVSGNGSIEAMPDFISLQISIEKTGKNKAQTKDSVDRITQQVLDAAKQLEIADKNIEASELAIYPQYEWKDNQRIDKGDTVSRTVNIKLHQLARYSELADALAQLDITRFQQTGHGFDHPQQLQNQALVKALKNAQHTAELIAKTYQRQIGKVYSVSQSNSAMPVPRFAMMSMADSNEARSAPLNIQPQTINVTVNVIFLLK